MSDDEGEEGETESGEEPEEASIRARHVVEEGGLEEAANSNKKESVSNVASLYGRSRYRTNVRLLRRRQAPPVAVPPIRPQLRKARESRQAHRGESQQHPRRLPLPVPLVALPRLARAGAPTKAVEVEAVEEEADGEGEDPERKVGDGAAESGGPPVEAICGCWR